jgi:hypothetical protein
MFFAGARFAAKERGPNATLWAQVMPHIKPHPELVVASEGQIGWVMRKDSPELKKLGR